MVVTAAEARAWVPAPGPADDKYSRGVLGMVTGSERYPGAAVLGAEAAARVGVGMVRHVGPDRVTDLVLARRPEVVPGAGRVDAWVLGSGQAADERDAAMRDRLDAAIADGVPTVLDAGALDLVRRVHWPTIVTPHAGELRRMLERLGTSVDRDDVLADPERWARRASEACGVVVLLKGARTVVVSGSEVRQVDVGTHWLATAGTGDVLAGIVGALLASHPAARDPAELVDLAAAAAWLHAAAGSAASGGGPVVALDVAEALPGVVAQLVSG